MDALQADIDALEHEKTELRERVKDLSRKTLMEGIVRQSNAAGNHEVNAATIYDETLYLVE
jgi:hypothetical protein